MIFFSIFQFVSAWHHSTHKYGSNLFIQPLCTHSCTSFHSVNWPGSFLISFPLPWLISRDKSHPEILEQKRPLWDNLSSLFDRWRKWGKVICPWAQGQIRLTDWLTEWESGFPSPTPAYSALHYEVVRASSRAPDT